MILDAHSSPKAPIEADCCVVGGGAAGITLALELSRRGRTCIIVESGGESFSEKTQDLYRGLSFGTPPARRKDYLFGSRLRFLGGSTNHWEGYCRPLDPVDFEARKGVSSVGWPFGRSTLEPWYGRAAQILSIPPFSLEEPSVDIGLTCKDLHVKYFHLSPPTRFGKEFRDELAESPRIQVLINANLVSLETSANGSRVSEVRYKTLGGLSGLIRAKRYVLATGGVENARLLLTAAPKFPQGLGNESGLVGRYFMEHPQFRACVLGVREGLQDAMFRTHTVDGTAYRRKAVFTLSEQLLRSNGVLNASLQIDPIAASHRSLTDIDRQLVDSLLAPSGGGGIRFYSGFLRLEQTPHPESRVVVDASDRDALGIPRAKLYWKLSDDDYSQSRKFLALVGQQLAIAGVGRLKILSSERNRWPGLAVSSHHMGTTRMGNDSRTSVVDPNCRLHGVTNMFVAGSSVFPTSGFANPTLTVVALALRLAEHLHGDLAHG